jgi:cytoskeletal protein CcmA (bactofilin family)
MSQFGFLRGKQAATAQTALPSPPTPAPAPVAEAPKKKTTILAADTLFEGNIKSSEQLIVEGTLRGDLAVKSVLIAQSGKVYGNIEAENAVIIGRVEGKVAVGTIQLQTTAHIIGPVHYGKLDLAGGAIIEGEMQRLGAEARKTAVSTDSDRAMGELVSIAGGKLQSA